MSYEFYLFLHIVSVIAVFITTGAIASHFWQGGTKANLKNRKAMMSIHGIAMLVAFVSAFGLIAKVKYSFTADHWLYIKMICWLFLGAFPILMFKNRIPGKAGTGILIVIALIAVGTVVFLPNKV